MKTKQAIEQVCDDIKALLLEKNAKYGDSALSPKRIFSSSGSIEQILVRIDDKLSRIATRGFRGEQDKDTLSDLIGYLVLLKVAARAKVEPNALIGQDFTGYEGYGMDEDPKFITGRDPGDEHDPDGFHGKSYRVFVNETKEQK